MPTILGLPNQSGTPIGDEEVPVAMPSGLTIKVTTQQIANLAAGAPPSNPFYLQGTHVGPGTYNEDSIAGDDPHWLEIANDPSVVAGPNGFGLQLLRINSFGVNSYGNNVHFCRYRGSAASPAAVQLNDVFSSFGWRGHDGVALSQSAAAWQFIATENWAAGAHGIKARMELTANGSTSRVGVYDVTTSAFNLLLGEFQQNGISVKTIEQNSQSTGYTAVLADANKHLLHPSADTTARIFTIPANGSVAYPIGTALTFVNQNAAGVLTIAITTDTMRLAGAGTTGSRTLAANGVATALKITATEWIISGTNLT